MLIDAAKSYVALRRATGFAFKSEGSQILNFAKYSDAAGRHYICAETAIHWAQSAPTVYQRARKLGHVIRFARFIRAEDQGHEIPTQIFGAEKRSRPVPYIFSREDVQRLVQAASQLGKRNAFRGHTYSTLFALLACNGLRVSEALHLCFQDITNDGLIIRCTKFRKSRLVPLHTTARVGLERYLDLRRAFSPLDQHVFISLRQRPLLLDSAETAFSRCSKEDQRLLWSRTSSLHDTFSAPYICGQGAGNVPGWPRSHHQAYADVVNLPWSWRGRKHLLVSGSHAGSNEKNCGLVRSLLRWRPTMTLIAPHVTAFLQQRLPIERSASINTCDSYAHAFRLLFEFAAKHIKVPPSKLCLEQIDAAVVVSFLNDLETARRNSVSSRNVRLAAIKSFMHYMEYRVPSAIDQIRRILAVPSKKTVTRLVRHLTSEEMQSILDAPDPTTRDGIRDRAMLHLCFAGGLRVSELIGLRNEDVVLRPQTTVLIHGKGRKERCLPLWKETVTALRAWLSVRGQARVPELFPNARNDSMTRAGFEYILHKHVQTAAKHCPSLSTKRVSPHVLRHTCAMTILLATKDLRKVSLWLGHSSTKTTEIYTRADPMVKLEALESAIAPKLRTGRFKATDKLIALLKDATIMPSKKSPQ